MSLSVTAVFQQDPPGQEHVPPEAPAVVEAPAAMQALHAGLRVEVAALSDVGSVRTNNEDAFGYDPARQIYVVCDGMGGMASGEVASQTAVLAFLQAVANSHPAASVGSILAQAIANANDAVYVAGTAPEHHGMGTTLVAACVEDGKLFLGNVGDSRAYLVQNGRCMQLTIDHSYLNEMIRQGIVSIENAANVDLKGMESVITRAIGVTPTIDPDFFSVDLTPGDVVLLASDGLSRYVSPNEIAQIVRCMDLHLSGQSLIALAKERGGADNITVVLLHIAPAGDTSPGG